MRSGAVWRGGIMALGGGGIDQLGIRERELAQIPIFAELPREELKKVAELGEFEDIVVGSEIETPQGIMLIIGEGRANCFIRDAAEKRFLLGILEKGDVLGELSYLTPQGSRDQKVELQAVEPMRCFRAPVKEIFDILTSEPKANMLLLRMFAARLSAMNGFAMQAVDVNIDPTLLPATSFGEKVADFVSERVGTWYFLVGGAVFTTLWMLLNAIGWMGGYDPYPFIFLNLIFSVVSAATMPVLLMSQNRQNQLDRIAAHVNHMVNLRSNQMLESILGRLTYLESKFLSDSKDDI